ERAEVRLEALLELVRCARRRVAEQIREARLVQAGARDVGAGGFFGGASSGHAADHWSTFVLRTPVFALGAARRAHWSTFVLRTPVFALGAARRAHAAIPLIGSGFASPCMISRKTSSRSARPISRSSGCAPAPRRIA